MKQLTIVLVSLHIFVFTAFFSMAQEDEPDFELSLRLVCIESIGCLHTALDDEALDIQFGTDLERFEAGGNFEPAGVWDYAEIENNAVCDAETLLEQNPRMVLITAIDDSDDINVMDDYSLTDSLYTRIGDGVYVGRETVADAVTFIQYLEFLIIENETTMYSFSIGTRDDGFGVTAINFIRCYSYLGPG